MSITVSTDVFCDGDGCLTWIAGVTGSHAAAQDARAEARLYGWVRRLVGGRYLDLCPECQEDT